MDSQRFDALTRLLAAPGSRRQLLRALVGGALAMTALGRRPLGAKAAVDCGNGYGCGDGQSCCNYPSGVFGGCCTGGVCCTDADGITLRCCGANQTCGPTGLCVAAGCPATFISCGTSCCSSSQVCLDGQCIDACGPGGCLPPPPPPPPPDYCLGHTCNGVCCAQGVGCDVGGDCAATCPAGQISCRGTCMSPCPPKAVLNSDTCACERTRPKPKPCPKGKACGGRCCGKGERCEQGTCKRK